MDASAVTYENTDQSLIEEIEKDGSLEGWVVEEFIPEDQNDGSQIWQVVFNSDYRRAGLIFLGSGSNGVTLWTDAISTNDAYQRVLVDNLMP